MNHIIAEQLYPIHNGKFNIFENTFQFDYVCGDDPMVLAIRKTDLPKIQELCKNFDPNKLLEKFEIWEELRIEVKCNYIGLALASFIAKHSLENKITDQDFDQLHEVLHTLHDNKVSIKDKYQWLFYKCPDNFWSYDVTSAIEKPNLEILKELLKILPDSKAQKFNDLIKLKEIVRNFIILKALF